MVYIATIRHDHGHAMAYLTDRDGAYITAEDGSRIVVDELLFWLPVTPTTTPDLLWEEID